MPKVLACTIIFSFVAMAFCVLFGQLQTSTVLAGTVIGYLSAKAEQVVAYYFGSTANSSRKTELLAQSAPVRK